MIFKNDVERSMRLSFVSKWNTFAGFLISIFDRIKIKNRLLTIMVIINATDYTMTFQNIIVCLV